MDMDSVTRTRALRQLRDTTMDAMVHSVVAIKHGAPCGVATVGAAAQVATMTVGEKLDREDALRSAFFNNGNPRLLERQQHSLKQLLPLGLWTPPLAGAHAQVRLSLLSLCLSTSAFFCTRVLN